MTTPSTFSKETKSMSALTVTEQILQTPQELITIDSSEMVGGLTLPCLLSHSLQPVAEVKSQLKTTVKWQW